jgi:hypothetical protein
MPFLPEKPFNPKVSKVPILSASSGNPASFQDPNSVASAGARIQAMADQAQADTLYDAQPTTSEGFRNAVYSPWILRTDACREGFTGHTQADKKYILLGILGLLVIMLSMR